ncbi:energy-coupling factor ABC transporter ATP-binding protein [Streptomyces malaysiensis]|uniref:hypothetical protein n=1 Tax=Streptomyces malaysiensis TaxID=92644 RepID=UPI00163D95CD|nr:hypothetical protein [Streptomyces malaysiensis]
MRARRERLPGPTQLAEGKAALFVTHNLDNARIADRIIVLDGGRIVESGTFDRFRVRASWRGSRFLVVHDVPQVLPVGSRFDTPMLSILAQELV